LAYIAAMEQGCTLRLTQQQLLVAEKISAHLSLQSHLIMLSNGIYGSPVPFWCRERITDTSRNCSLASRHESKY
jgi:hypothetical protein